MVALASPAPAHEIEVEVVNEPYEHFNHYLWPQQTLAFKSPANDILFGGAKGPGKSFLIRFAHIMWGIEAPGYQGYIFRRIWEDLKQNHLEGPTSFGIMLAKMEESKHCRILSHEIRFWNGSRIFLRHLQLEKHVLKYQGPEMHGFSLDEMTQFTEKQIKYLQGSLRLGKWRPPRHMAGQFPRQLHGANPGGISHTFVKKRYVDLGAYRISKPTKYIRRQFIPASNTDNPDLLRNDPGYLDRLEDMGDLVLVRAMKEGDWKVALGSMFGEAWRETKNGKPWHVMPNARIPYGWDLWRGGDDGFSSPLAYYWFAQDPLRKTIYVIDELFGSNIQPHKAAELTIERDLLLPMIHDGQYVTNPEILTGMLDSEAFSKEGTGEHEITRGDQMNALGARWRKVEKWPGSRVARVKNFHRLLAPNKLSANVDFPDGRPGIVFFEKCVNAIEQIPTLPRSPNDPEDIDPKFPHDHSFDGVTYGCQYRLGGFKKMGIAGL